MSGINEILDGFGVEYCESIDDDYFKQYGIEYVNTGDVYNATIVYDYSNGRYYVTTMGDYIESQPDNRFI